MGPNLLELSNICDNNLDEITIINITIELIKNMELIHNANILHSDIKPDNICYGNLSSGDKKELIKINLIDFGNSILYKIKNQLIAHKYNNKPLCTREYSSLNVLRGETFSRRDDLESIIYVAIQLYKNKLPWDDIKHYCIGSIAIDNKAKLYKDSNSNSQNLIKSKIKNIIDKNEKKERLDIDELIFVHQNLSFEEICEGMPKEYLIVYELIKKLSYREKPNYSLIIDIFEKAKIRILHEKKNEIYSSLNFGNTIYKFKWEYLFNDLIIYDKIDNLKNYNEALSNFEKRYCLNLKKYFEEIQKCYK